MENRIQKVSIVGYGNIGSHLVEAFCNAGIEVTHILVRDLNKNTTSDNHFISDYSQLPKDQLVIVCVPDNEVAAVIQQIIGCPIAYTSGSVNLSELDLQKEIGVFYPLQTFTKCVHVDLSTVPFFIESESQLFGEQLFELAKKLSSNVKYANSLERAKLHLAAVWVNNFTNHVNFIAKEYLDSQALNFEDLLPLLRETIRKIEVNNPLEVQTGPARRGDHQTIAKHLQMLDLNRREMYRLLSDSILNTYHKND